MLSLTVSRLLSGSDRGSAVASVLPTSALGLSAGSVTIVLAGRKVTLPPSVVARITPVVTPAGTVEVTIC